MCREATSSSPGSCTARVKWRNAALVAGAVMGSAIAVQQALTVRPRHRWRLATGLRRTTLVRLQAAVQTHSGRGIVAARTAVRLVRERVDSPRETWLRLCLVLPGLPVPECNLIIGDDQGPIGRVDLVNLANKLIIEYEGDQHRTDATSGTATSTAMKTSPETTGH